MADESRNPADNAEMRRLERDLRGVLGELRADLRQGQELQAQAHEQQRKAETRAQRESRARQARTAGRVGADEPAAVAESASQAERLAAARERGARAAKASEQSERQVAQQLRAQRLLPRAGGTTGGFQGGLTPAEVRARAERGGLQTGGVRGPGGGPPPRPPAPPAPAAPGGGGQPPRNLREVIDGYRRAAAAGQGFSEQETDVARRAREMAADTGRMNGALERSTRAIGLSSNAMQKHGYLTSEFINAARKGQVTFRELGEQVTGTISKFGGWTIAAGSVYAAVGAVAALGRGAIESNRGVNQLSRVITSGFDTDSAQQQFRALAHEMNLPISDVVDAAYGMSKVFNDQNAALAATEQALFAVKVGELDAGTATRYLTSIVAGFGMTAAELPTVFDAINNAQNRFGGNVGQITAGVAKAAGSFRLAGGNYKELISLIVAGTRLTGTTGENVGTAISRSASNVLTPQGQKRLRAAGLNPQQDYPRLLAQAMKEAQGASRERVSEIARALVPAGGQFTRVFVPILENARLYNKVMGEVQPEKAKGSAQRELTKTLHSMGEQLRAIINNIEQFGSSFAQAGGLDVLGGGVYALNQMLHVSTLLMDQFNRLPKPLREAAVVMLELYGITRLLRRFDVGASIPQGSRGQLAGFGAALRRPPAQAQRAQILSGLGAEQKFLADASERTAQQAGLAQYQAVRAAERHADLLRTGAASQEEVERSARTVVSRQEEAARLAADQEDLSRRLAVVRQQEQQFGEKRYRNEQQVTQAARRAGIHYQPPTLERQSAQQPIGVGETPATTFIPTGTSRAGQERYLRSQAALRRAAEDARGFATKAGVSGRLAGGALTVAGTSGLVAARGVASLGKGLAGFGRSIAASLGPLDVALIGVLAAVQSYSYITGRLEEADRKAEELASTAGGAGAIRARADREQNQRSLLERGQNAFADAHNFFADNGLGRGRNHIDSPDQIEDRQARAAKDLAASIEKAQSKGALLGLTDIGARVERRVNGARTRADKISGIEKGLDEIDHSYARVFGGKVANRAADALRDQFKAKLADIRAAGSSLDEIMAGLTNESQISTFVGRLQNRVALNGVSGTNVKRAGIAAARARSLAAQASDPQEAAKLLQDAQNAENAILQPAEQRLNNLIAVARNPHDQLRARRNYLGQVRQALGIDAQRSRITELQSAIGGREKQIEQLAREVSEAPPGISSRGGRQLVPLQQLGIPGLANLPAGKITVSAEEAKKSAALKRLRERQKTEQSELRALRRNLGITNEQFKAIQHEQNKAQAEAELASFDTRTGLLQSRTADPLASARILSSRLAQRVQIVRGNLARHLATEDDLNNAIAQQNQALQQLAQARIANFQSQQQLATANFALGTRNQGSILSRGVADAQRFANFVRSQGNKVDPNAYRSALTEVANARKALQDYIRQQAEAMVSARSALALASTDDPVKQAEIRAREAQQLVQFANDPADKIRRIADARRARRDLPTIRGQAKLDDIEFQRDIEQISAQTEYAMLSSLLKTKGLTQEFRRNVMRRMHQVKKDMENDSAGFDMNVGDIKLPTVYEIRRAIKGASRGGSQYTVQNNNRIELVVADGADVDEVFERVDQITGSSLKATARSAGVR